MSDRLLGRWWRRGGRRRGRFGGGRRRLLGRRFRCCGCGLSDRHRDAEQAPLSIYGREREFEIDLLGDRRKQARHMHEAVGLDLRQQAQLRIRSRRRRIDRDCRYAAWRKSPQAARRCWSGRRARRDRATPCSFQSCWPGRARAAWSGSGSARHCGRCWRVLAPARARGTRPRRRPGRARRGTNRGGWRVMSFQSLPRAEPLQQTYHANVRPARPPIPCCWIPPPTAKLATAQSVNRSAAPRLTAFSPRK